MAQENFDNIWCDEDDELIEAEWVYTVETALNELNAAVTTPGVNAGSYYEEMGRALASLDPEPLSVIHEHAENLYQPIASDDWLNDLDGDAMMSAVCEHPQYAKNNATTTINDVLPTIDINMGEWYVNEQDRLPELNFDDVLAATHDDIQYNAVPTTSLHFQCTVGQKI